MVYINPATRPPRLLGLHGLHVADTMGHNSDMCDTPHEGCLVTQQSFYVPIGCDFAQVSHLKSLQLSSAQTPKIARNTCGNDNTRITFQGILETS